MAHQSQGQSNSESKKAKSKKRKSTPKVIKQTMTNSPGAIQAESVTIMTDPPRTITAVKQAQMLEILKSEPRGVIDISWVMGNDEARDFANQIGEVLRSAGWQVTMGSPATEGTSPRNIGIFVRSERTPGAGALQQALGKVGFPAVGILNPEFPEQRIGLFVAQKPSN